MVSGSQLFQNDLSRRRLMCNLTSCVLCTKSSIRFQKIIRETLCQCFQIKCMVLEQIGSCRRSFSVCFPTLAVGDIVFMNTLLCNEVQA